MIVLFILMYFVMGLGIACSYNAAKNVPLPDDMNEDQKRMMFLVTMFWPIFAIIWIIGFILWFIKYFYETAKWGINKLKKK